MTYRLSLISCLALALTTAGFAEPAPEEVIKTSLQLISKKDWGGLYEMASETQKKRMGITKEQFVRLNQVITDGFPKNLNCKYYESRKVQDGWFSAIYKMKSIPLLAPDFDKDTRKSVSVLDLRFVDGRWAPEISFLPMDLLACRQEVKKVRHQRLLNAMQKAGISHLTLNDPPRKLSAKDLQLVIQGKLTLRQAFHRI